MLLVVCGLGWLYSWRHTFIFIITSGGPRIGRYDSRSFFLVLFGSTIVPHGCSECDYLFNDIAMLPHGFETIPCFSRKRGRVVCRDRSRLVESLPLPHIQPARLIT